MKACDPPPFDTGITDLTSALQRKVEARDWLTFDLPPAGRFLEPGEVRAAADRLTAECATMRHGGVKYRLSLRQRRDAWDIVLPFSKLGETLPDYVQLALAFAMPVDRTLAHRDRLDSLVRMKAAAIRSGREMTPDELGKHVGVTGQRVRDLWAEWGALLDERVEQVNRFYAGTGTTLTEGTAEWDEAWQEHVPHEREYVLKGHVPYLVAAMMGGDWRQQAVARYCTFLLVTSPRVVTMWDDALFAVAAVLCPWAKRGQL